MAGFILRKDPKETASFELVGMNSTVAVVGDLFYLNIGSTYWILATSPTGTKHWMRYGVAAEAITSAMDYGKIVIVTPEQTWEASSANNSNVDHNGDRMILTDENTVSNTGTDSTDADACVEQVGTIGAVTDKRILVKFLGGSGANPDAT